MLQVTKFTLDQRLPITTIYNCSETFSPLHRKVAVVAKNAHPRTLSSSIPPVTYVALNPGRGERQPGIHCTQPGIQLLVLPMPRSGCILYLYFTLLQIHETPAFPSEKYHESRVMYCMKNNCENQE